MVFGIVLTDNLCTDMYYCIDWYEQHEQLTDRISL